MTNNNNNTPPIAIHELIQLSNIGIPAEQVTWNRVTMTSDRWIAIRHGNKEESSSMQVTVLCPKEGSISYVGQTSADSIQINPSEPVIALKAGIRFEVFNFHTKQLISKTKLHEPVVYWTWLNAEIIAMVTETTIYHWPVWQDCCPEKVFMRHQRLDFAEIVSYKADSSMKWLAVTGLIPEEEKISGFTQLYYTEEDITQCIPAHAVCFANYQYDDNPLPSTVLCASTRDTVDIGKVHVIELGPYKQGNFAPRNNYDHVQYYDGADMYDFTVSLHVSIKYGLLFMITKYGYLYLCDMETAACLCCNKISNYIMFTSTLNTDTQGIMGVNRGGQVLTMGIKKDGLVSHVRDKVKKTSQADRLEKAISS